MRMRTRMLLQSLLVVVSLGTVSSASLAQEQLSEKQIQELLRVKTRTVRHLALNPLLVRATREQNAQSLSLEEIKRRDAEWRDSKDPTPFMLSLQNSDAGRFLRSVVERSTSFNEAFLTDDQGANVATYPFTSDYWQGDEEKWSVSFNGGEGKVFIGPLELDSSTQTYAVQVSAPVLDRGRTIGVLVVGVTLTYLDTRRQ